METGPDTLKSCLACGGNNVEDCPWCTDGYMDKEQERKWKVFRQKMKSLSKTYTFLQDITKEIIARLRNVNKIKPQQLADHGEDLLEKWSEAEDRASLTSGLSKFNKEALDYLMDENN